MSEPSFPQRLKERKLVQWALAYLAGAWVVYEGSGTAFETWDVPVLLVRSIHVLLIVGFFITIVLAWYHGEKGRQRVSGPELLMVAALLVIAGTGLSFLGGRQTSDHLSENPRADEAYDPTSFLNRLPSIAVLPFANRSELPSDQYFTDGVQDALLTRLQRVSGLKVISRTSSDTYRDTDKTISEVGRELDADYVIEGGVLRAGGQVRIHVQLIDAETDSHLWAGEYDRELSIENLLDIQSEIVSTVAGELNIELRQEEVLRAARRSTADAEAYDLYLRGIGLGFFNEEALLLFQEAVDRDPGFVGAHALLAMGHSVRFSGAGPRDEERAERARSAARRAIDLAPESEDAQLAMGIYLYRVERDYEEALDWLGRASGTLSGDYDYQRYKGLVERRMGLWRRSVVSLEAATTLSPRDPRAWTDLGSVYLQMRRYPEAESTLIQARPLSSSGRLASIDRSMGNLIWIRDGVTDGYLPFLERNLPHVLAWEIAMTDGRHAEALTLLEVLPEDIFWLAFYYPKTLLEAETLEALGQPEAARERYRDAIAKLEALVEETPGDERYHAGLAWGYAALGMGEEAMREAQRAVDLKPRERDAAMGPDLLFNLAAIHARLGEVDEAVEVLEDLLSAPSRYAPNMLEDHFRFRSIQDDPRFKALMDRERDKVF